MTVEYDLLCAFEEHAPQDIGKALAAGISPVELIKGKRPIDILIEAYLRSPRFAESPGAPGCAGGSRTSSCSRRWSCSRTCGSSRPHGRSS